VGEYIDFLQRAFGAVEEARHTLPSGAVPHARVRIGDAAVEMGGPADPMPGAYFLYVADADAVYEQALAAGAKSLSAPADRPSGDRIAFVEDPVGNYWYIARS
jgi:PhnB protein